MWYAFGISYLTILVHSQTNQNIAWNTTENSSVWNMNNVIKNIENDSEKQYSLIERSEWNAASPTTNLHNLKLPVEQIIIAHTATSECHTRAQCITRVKAIQQYHIESRNLSDIGYNFLIGGDGSIYEGRGWNKVGVHTKHYNNVSICIAFIGDFELIPPQENQLNACKQLIDDGLKLEKLKFNYILYAHNQLTPTLSPGKELFKLIKTWPHFLGNSNLTINDLPLNIISRTNWIAQPSSAELNNLQLPVKLVIFAHTPTESCFTQAKCALKVRFIQTFHMESRGFDDIGYNFLIGGDGSIFEGRGWNKIGAHTKGYNYESICIAFIGNFILNQPTSQQLNASLELIKYGIRINKLSSDYEIKGQTQIIATESPGRMLFNIIKHWPHFSNDQSITENKFINRFITRNEWIAQPSNEPLENLTLPVQNVIIAHTATEPCSTQAQCTFRIRYIQTFHIESRGFLDIAYNFLIGGDGRIYEGCGWDKMGAHTKGFNNDSICIAFVGTFNTVLPNELQLNATKELIDDGIKLGKLKSDYNLYGHKQLIATVSPGEKLFKEISLWPHFVKNSETEEINAINEVKT